VAARTWESADEESIPARSVAWSKAVISGEEEEATETRWNEDAEGEVANRSALEAEAEDRNLPGGNVPSHNRQTAAAGARGWVTYTFGLSGRPSTKLLSTLHASATAVSHSTRPSCSLPPPYAFPSLSPTCPPPSSTLPSSGATTQFAIPISHLLTTPGTSSASNPARLMTNAGQAAHWAPATAPPEASTKAWA